MHSKTLLFLSTEAKELMSCRPFSEAMIEMYQIISKEVRSDALCSLRVLREAIGLVASTLAQVFKVSSEMLDSDRSKYVITLLTLMYSPISEMFEGVIEAALHSNQRQNPSLSEIDQLMKNRRTSTAEIQSRDPLMVS